MTSVLFEEADFKNMYEFNPSPDLSIFFIFDVRRNVPYFYDTFWVKKIIVASRL